jgi:hypothetical protein
MSKSHSPAAHVAIEDNRKTRQEVLEQIARLRREVEAAVARKALRRAKR